MKFYISFLLLLALKAGAVTPACTIEDVHTADMVPKREQGPTGDCYAFAGVGLIQNFYCRTKGTPCNSSDDNLSVLDAIGMANQKRIKSGGHTEQVLNAIKYAGGLFKESCAPFTPFLKNGGVVGRIEAKWHYVIRTAMEQSANPQTTSQQRDQIARDLKEQLGTSVDVDTIKNSLTKRDISIVTYDLTIPQKCESERVPLKKFNIQGYKSDPKDQIKSQLNTLSAVTCDPKVDPATNQRQERIRENIIDKLKRKIPLQTNFCALNPADAAKARLNGSQVDFCAAHALDIMGVRKRCCGSACSYEYQFYDSANTFAKSEFTEDGWIKESNYFERIRRYWSFAPIEVSDRDLLWLE